ncbi:extracellular solute-binding protein [Nonomuraea soli]|uniref:Putative aldouronate transport system substrate-binding protein n=1 Tax=Nonomuraea soli TaxID=1032476 RepID=A0A7W0CME6_9ACTN|nr:extracellular solute-binding protein [Nonomuraea soli]MBA2893838.1 putative aldouronate transport system substrate-binding protein [Nonomuraea soli]
MNHSPRRLLAGMLALTTVLTAAACGSEGEGGGEAASNSLTMMVPLFGTAPSPQGEIHQAVEKLTGKKLQITWVPNAEYPDKTNVTLASGNIPDVMVIQDNKGAQFVKTAEAGAFWDLTDKLDKYPNLKPKTEQGRINSQTNGKNYGVYRVRPLLRSAVMIRKDWLEKLGLQPPKTTEDLYTIAKAFTEKDPDGNGKKDTYGLILPKWPSPSFSASSPYNAIDVWFGAPNNYGMRDGKLITEFDAPEFWEAQKYIKRFIDEGLVNPDWATLDTAKWNDPFVQGKGGISIDVNVRTGQLYDLFKEVDPQGYQNKVTMVGNLARPDGQKTSLPFTGFNGIITVSKARIKTEQQLDDVLKFLDKLASKEGSVLLTNGIEGRNFKVENGFAVKIDDQKPEMKTIKNDVESAFIQLGMTSSVGVAGGAYEWMRPTPEEQAWQKERDVIAEEDLKTAVHDPSLPHISKTAVEKGATLNPIPTDARIKHLAGQLTDDELKAEFQRWHTSGGDQIIAELTELIGKTS